MAQESVVLIVRFVPKEGKRQEFLGHLYKLVDLMAKEPEFVNTIVHEDLNRPNEIVLYEIWRCSKEHWAKTQPTKAYRENYEAGVPELLVRREVDWFVPIEEWGSNLTKEKQE